VVQRTITSRPLDIYIGAQLVTPVRHIGTTADDGRAAKAAVCSTAICIDLQIHAPVRRIGVIAVEYPAA